MAGYRFCRSDDIPLLVEAYNACYRVHFTGGPTGLPVPSAGASAASPPPPEMTVDAFKRMTRELNVWTSSCMVASAEGRPVGVMLAAKRDGDANWIHSLGVVSDFQRQGHGKHLLTSLSQKLAILGPRRMTLELPDGATVARRFVESCGYAEEGRYTDYVRPAEPGPGGEVPPVVVPMPLLELADLVDLANVSGQPKPSWRRSRATLLNRADSLHALAVPAGDRIEAYVVYDDAADPAERRLVAFDVREPSRRDAMLTLLFGTCATTTTLPLALRQISPEELDATWLEHGGWQPGARTVAYATEAQPG